MGSYMPKVGTLGLDMMLRTCTVQVNLDFADEADMRRVPHVAGSSASRWALFANCPSRTGPFGVVDPCPCLTDTDAARSGVPACVFDDYFGYEQWTTILDAHVFSASR